MSNVTRLRLVAIIFSMIVLSDVPPLTADTPEHVQQKAEALMQNWRTVTPEILRDPANAKPFSVSGRKRNSRIEPMREFYSYA
jgi:hypothetical protein